jgi:hypothetical protein
MKKQNPKTSPFHHLPQIIHGFQANFYVFAFFISIALCFLDFVFASAGYSYLTFWVHNLSPFPYLFSPSILLYGLLHHIGKFGCDSCQIPCYSLIHIPVYLYI